MISIVISTKGKDSQGLRPTLSSIRNFLTDFELIVVDQNERDLGIQTLVENCKADDNNNLYIYLRDKQAGLSAGRNLGLKYSTKNWVWFLDDDAIISTSISKDIEEVLHENEKKAVILYGTVRELESKKPFIKRSIQTRKLHFWNFDSVCSVALIFNRKIFEELGGFDEKFGVGATLGAGEESDVIIRALKNKVNIAYLNKLVVYHPKAIRKSSKLFSYGLGVGALYRKHICSLSYYTLVLGAKAIIEILMKSFLVFIMIFSNKNESELHLSFLKGFTRGFFAYTKQQADNIPEETL